MKARAKGALAADGGAQPMKGYYGDAETKQKHSLGDV